MKMKVCCSGFDGEKPYKAGVVDLPIEHAKKVFVQNHGDPVNKKDMPVSFDEAVNLLRLSDDDKAIATLNRAEV